MSSSSPSSAMLVARLSNLTPAVTGNHLRELLGSEVKVHELRMPEPVLWMNCPTGRAEVIGETETDTKQVFVRLHGAQLDGARINVNLVRIDSSLPPVPVGRARRVEERSAAADSHRTRGRRSHSRDRDHSHHHQRHTHQHGRRRSRSPSDRSRSPAAAPPPKQARTDVAPNFGRGILPTPTPATNAPRPSRSPSPVWE